MSSPVKPLPTNDKQKVLVEDPLYTEYDLSNISDDDFAEFVFKSMAIDAYCPKCQKNSVFRIVGSTYITKEKVEEIPKFGLVNIEAKCSRNGEGSYGNCPEKLFFCFNFNRDYKRLIKIGQYPSKAVLDFGELDPVFSQELDKDFREELGRAIGLRAGVAHIHNDK